MNKFKKMLLILIICVGTAGGVQAEAPVFIKNIKQWFVDTYKKVKNTLKRKEPQPTRFEVYTFNDEPPKIEANQNLQPVQQIPKKRNENKPPKKSRPRTQVKTTHTEGYSGPSVNEQLPVVDSQQNPESTRNPKKLQKWIRKIRKKRVYNRIESKIESKKFTNRLIKMINHYVDIKMEKYKTGALDDETSYNEAIETALCIKNKIYLLGQVIFKKHADLSDDEKTKITNKIKNLVRSKGNVEYLEQDKLAPNSQRTLFLLNVTNNLQRNSVFEDENKKKIYFEFYLNKMFDYKYNKYFQMKKKIFNNSLDKYFALDVHPQFSNNFTRWEKNQCQGLIGELTSLLSQEDENFLINSLRSHELRKSISALKNKFDNSFNTMMENTKNDPFKLSNET